MGVSMITDVLITSPILQRDDMGGGAAMGDVPANAGGGNIQQENAFAAYGGVDPNLEPELAEAMRISLEEERHRLKDSEAEVEKDQPANAAAVNNDDAAMV